MKRRQINHFKVAEHCRANPGVWQPVGEYNSTSSAHGAAAYIRNARVRTPHHASPYAPAGAFEARRMLTEFGALVEARYVGASPDTAALDGGTA